MGQAIKIGGVDYNRMVGRWTDVVTAQKDAEYIDIPNPFNTTSITVEPYCETADTPNNTDSIAVTGQEISNTTIKLKFDKLEKKTNFKCKVYIIRGSLSM